MANDHFQFKEFTIYQDRCAMKVCTDACILGAWAAKKIPGIHSRQPALPPSILDIGSGTGLLMMMLAQQSESVIHGIEIDEQAYAQAGENIQRNLRFSTRLSVFQGDARSFTFPLTYDFIIANPPFYHNDLKGNIARENLAKHSVSLDFNDLLDVIRKNLSEGGAFAILLPLHRWKEFDRMAEGSYTLTDQVFIRQTPAHDFFRAIACYSKNSREGQKTALSELTIKDDQGVYTEAFSALLKPYYLHL